MRQMIGRIGEGASRHEEEQMVLMVPHRRSGTAVTALMNTGPKDAPRLLTIREDPLSIAPSVGGEEKRHREELFPVRCGTHSILRAIRSARPGEIAFVLAFVHIHIRLRPFPDPVEDVLHVQLDGHHHAVGHPLCTDIVISGIHQIAHILSGFVIDPLLLIEEERMHRFVDFALDFFLGLPDLEEHIPVCPVLQGDPPFGHYARISAMS